MNRRKFLNYSGVLLGSSCINPILADVYQNDFEKITILHTNDVHSHIDVFDKNHSLYSGKGGVARRATLIKQIREEEKNVLLLDAGDIFQGTPYFNLFQGKMEYDIMNYLKYDGATLGNHDFDIGLEGLNNQIVRANFSMINANYNFEDTILSKKIIPHKIFNKSGIRVGVFGIGIQLDGLVPDKLFNGVVQNDSLSTFLEQEKILKNKGCDIVICLSHLGYKYNRQISDHNLAEKSKFTDLIIGGHTHTFLDAPKAVKNSLGNEVFINQAGWAGLQLGRLDFYVDKQVKTSSVIGDNISIS